jgi:hypothetical protein
MRKVVKRTLFAASSLSILAFAVYAWAATSQANMRIDSISGVRSAGKDTYTVVVTNAGNSSAHKVRMSFRIPEELFSQNSSLPSPGANSSVVASPGGGGLNATCYGTTVTTYSGNRHVICTADRLDVNDIWSITIPVNNSSGVDYFANAQVFTDSPEGTTVGSTNMSDNFKGISSF